MKESMAQRMYRMIKAVDAEASITIATSSSQVPQIRAHLGLDVEISVEPCRRDTFPAIALAASYLSEKLGVEKDSPVIICPVDPYVEMEYFTCLKQMGDEVENGDSKLVLMGIEPTYASAKYGYIIPDGEAPVGRVKEFKEKPDEKTAAEYIKQGALWNGGVFACKLSYLLNKADDLLGTADYKALLGSYKKLDKISFDYAVVEK